MAERQRPQEPQLQSQQPCYKTADCQKDYCVDRQEQCYYSPECPYDYCIKPSEYQAMQTAPEQQQQQKNLLRRLSFLDRFLALWILVAMIVGVVIGYYVPGVQQSFATVQFASVSVPIAIGLLIMMYPVLCKVQYERLPTILRERQVWYQIAISIGINWIIGPIVMTGLAWATLPDLPTFRTGVVMVGLARCIAMVLIWNHLAGGDADYCALLVAINSILQIALFSPYAVLFINIVPSWFGASMDTAINVDIWPVARSVLIYLGIPLAAGIVTRFVLMKLTSRAWYEQKFLPWVGPWALIGLLYTIVVMFANQGHQIIDHIGSVFRVAVPLFVYFILMFFIPFFTLKALGVPYALVVTQAFTAGSNNFELAIAVAVGTYGIHSEQALAATIGPLIEVPVLLILTYVALIFERKLNWEKVRPWASKEVA
ncbi:sodium bile acid symporter family-domain-containing protein [Syncephalastrum racemosum]|uniref:Sodium bile acid symporter family-domain-containing protein n=1 Tax=Syncephalastrum racemosum TaxID=13706 RepID=A0A1X2HGW2_SYNRA|nr:sodium bile acid symporter family-domain-containing protein [Syncephalastrum racemosum]